MVTIQKIVIIGVILVTCCSFVSALCSRHYKINIDHVAGIEDDKCSASIPFKGCQQGDYNVDSVRCEAEAGYYRNTASNFKATCRDDSTWSSTGSDPCITRCPRHIRDSTNHVAKIADYHRCRMSEIMKSDQSCDWDLYNMSDIKCMKGYRARRNSGITATCNIDGTWTFSGNKPCNSIAGMCLTDDPGLNKPVHVSGVWKKSLCNKNTDSCLESTQYKGPDIKCDAGFVPRYHSQATCANGEWSYENTYGSSEHICHEGCPQYVRSENKYVERIFDDARCSEHDGVDESSQRCPTGDSYSRDSIECMDNAHKNPSSSANVVVTCAGNDEVGYEWQISGTPCVEDE